MLSVPEFGLLAHRWCLSCRVLIPMVLLAWSPSWGAEQEDKPSEDASKETSDGDERTDITDIGLEDLLGGTQIHGSTGSFGYRLSEYGIAPYVHAFGVGELSWESDVVPGFYGRFHVFIGADIQQRIIPEVHIAYGVDQDDYTEVRLAQLGGTDDAAESLAFTRASDPLSVPYAQIDVRAIEEKLIFRIGRFLIPIGSYNSVLYPEFINKSPIRPLPMRQIIPSLWSDNGVQVMGSMEWSKERSIRYGAYVVNGLLQEDDDLSDEVIPEGGRPREMRSASFEYGDGGLSLGGYFSAEPVPGVEIGVSGYTGNYTVLGKRRLSMADAHVSIERGKLTIHSEGVLAWQQITDGMLQHQGAYALVAFRVSPVFEPVIQLDGEAIEEIEEGEDEIETEVGAGVMGGLNMYPFPKQAANGVLKVAYRFQRESDEDRFEHFLIGQFAVGF